MTDLELATRTAAERHVHPALSALEGEGAQQYIPTSRIYGPPPEVLQKQVSVDLQQKLVPDYYGRPVLKEPVWIWSVPLYFQVGGVAGAAALLAAGLQLAPRREFDDLLRRCRWIGLAGAVAGSGLLTYDLGRPDRFYNMLRVVRPTSPMSLGSWTLAASGSALSAATLLAGRPGLPGLPGRVAGLSGGLLGPMLAGYTGVLLGNTAVPLWQESRRLLPLLFTASGMAGLGALLEITPLPAPARQVARSFGMAGQAVEVAATEIMEQRVSRRPEVGLPLRRGRSGLLWKTGKIMNAAGLLLSLAAAGAGASHRKKNRSRAKFARLAASALVTGGAVTLRYALFEAGKSSARDPQAIFAQQHSREAAT